MNRLSLTLLALLMVIGIGVFGGCIPKSPPELRNEAYIIVYPQTVISLTHYEERLVVDNEYGTPIIYTDYNEAIKHATIPSYIFKLYSKVQENPVQKLVENITGE